MICLVIGWAVVPQYILFGDMVQYNQVTSAGLEVLHHSMPGVYPISCLVCTLYHA